MQDIDIKGLNQLRLLNTMRREGVRIKRTRIVSQSEMRISLPRKDLNKGVAILERLCYNYTVIGSLTVRKRKFLAKLPLAVACVIAIAAAFASNLFVWRIEVDGAEGAMRMQVIEVINNCGVRAFSTKASVDEKRIAQALRETVGISAASVAMRGNVLAVSVLTSEEPQPPESGGNVLKSAFDGVITRIVVESGTATVKVGDTVKRGDVLITGELYSVSDGSLIGETKARGRAYATVTFGYSFPIASSDLIGRTGERTERTTLSLFGLTVGDETPPYPLYEAETRRDKLSPLPIEVRHTVYYRLDATEAEGEIDAYITEKCGELYALFGKEFAPRYDIIKTGGVATLKAYFTAEIPIGEI